MSNHQHQIQSIYKETFERVEEDSPINFIYAKAGEAYSKINALNIQMGYVSSDAFDHALVYYIAEWVKKNVKNINVDSLSQDHLAKNITDQILDYYKIQNQSQKEKISILFLTADPTNASRLRLGEESRVIDDSLQRAEMRSRFELHQRHSVRPEDVSFALLKHKPSILHFSGHGTDDGYICFEDRTGKSHPASPEALAALFQRFSKNVTCVLLNACYSEAQANAISKHIDYVIGMNKAITDDAALAFSIGFYQALGDGQSLKEAFEFGCVQIQLQNIPEHLTPILRSKY